MQAAARLTAPSRSTAGRPDHLHRGRVRAGLQSCLNKVWDAQAGDQGDRHPADRPPRQRRRPSGGSGGAAAASADGSPQSARPSPAAGGRGAVGPRARRGSSPSAPRTPRGDPAGVAQAGRSSSIEDGRGRRRWRRRIAACRGRGASAAVGIDGTAPPSAGASAIAWSQDLLSSLGPCRSRAGRTTKLVATRAIAIQPFGARRSRCRQRRCGPGRTLAP